MTWHRLDFPCSDLYALELREGSTVLARVYLDGTWTAWDLDGRAYHGPRPDPPKVCSAQRYAARWVAHARRPR